MQILPAPRESFQDQTWVMHVRRQHKIQIHSSTAAAYAAHVHKVGLQRCTSRIGSIWNTSQEQEQELLYTH